MFSSSESFTILRNELFKIVSKASEAGESAILAAEAVGDDVHHWRVRMKGFSGELARDLSAVESKFGYDYVEVEFTFTPDLHPFYPPQVRIVRPRFKGWILGAVMSHPMFVLSGWDPMVSTEAVIQHVRELLQKFGRVEVETATNCPRDYPASAYSELEVLLIRLELLTSTRPRAADRYPELYSNRDKEIDKNRLQMFRNLGMKSAKAVPGAAAAAPAKTYWAGGTGYGHSGGGKSETWDSQASILAQKHQDTQLEAVLNQLLKDLRGLGEGTATSSTDQHTFVFNSCLVPFLESTVVHTSLQDMGARHKYYSALFEALQYCFRLPWLVSELKQLGAGLAVLAKQSAVFQTAMQPSSTSASPRAQADSESEPDPLLALAQLIQNVHGNATAVLAAAAEGGGAGVRVSRRRAAKKPAAAAPAAAADEGGAGAAYIRALSAPLATGGSHR